jgi:hypothetical protein
MLPFLLNKTDASASGEMDKIHRKSDDEDKEFDGLHSAMEELHNAFLSKDYKAAAEIFRSAFDLLDSQPHVEGEHLGDDNG